MVVPSWGAQALQVQGSLLAGTSSPPPSAPAQSSLVTLACSGSRDVPPFLSFQECDRRFFLFNFYLTKVVFDFSLTISFAV